MPDCNKTWFPNASLEVLRLRAQMLEKIRTFFAERSVLEVETPLLSHASIPDPALHSFKTEYFLDTVSSKSQTFYLQTSPEFAMKRLLAAGSSSIYQISKAFRNGGEAGRYHNPEFTLLEWYRIDFTHHDLMDEVDMLLQILLSCRPGERFTYQQIFQNYLGIDPHQTSIETLQHCAQRHQIATEHLATLDHDAWLQLLMTHLIEPQLPNHPIFIYDFPASQAALARIRNEAIPVAEHFEVYVKGLELANGFHELCSATEQRQRFSNNQTQRKRFGYEAIPLDEHLLAALEQGLPNCAGVALGLDRLLLLISQKKTIQEVLTFPIERA